MIQKNGGGVRKEGKKEIVIVSNKKYRNNY